MKLSDDNSGFGPAFAPGEGEKESPSRQRDGFSYPIERLFIKNGYPVDEPS